MQLEKIEMSGFKSFADKTVIEFDKGVTAVVGPNGSGKSNLSEAIKWVLGEQSAKSLRGKKMDDVIFAGSQTRKPVNIAEVNLHINNEDGKLAIEHSQVVLTRRLNRNGDSDFFINKKACRLKDITSLMMDSGLVQNASFLANKFLLPSLEVGSAKLLTNALLKRVRPSMKKTLIGLGVAVLTPIIIMQIKKRLDNFQQRETAKSLSKLI